MSYPPQYAYIENHPKHNDEKEEEQILKPLKWIKSLKKHKVNTEVFIWGKAIPRNMFPQNQDQLTPWKSDQLSSKNIWDITTAREGDHCFAIGRNDWCFVWGETKHIGALGLGNNSRSTSPFRLKALAKQRVKQACCSAVHSLCITDNKIIYGWGSKSLTLLNTDTVSPTPLEFLNGKGLNRLCASNTHSLVWKAQSMQIYSFGMDGAWLGLDDDDDDAQRKTFGIMPISLASWMTEHKPSISFADCSSQYTLLILNTGYVGTCGINEHGRMGVGKAIQSSSKIIWNIYLRDIVLCAAASFHCGFVDTNGDVYTVGVGMDYCLGHAQGHTLWIPKQVEACDALDICAIECVAARTYVITTDGDLIMFGKEPINGRIHKEAFIYNYLSSLRIYKVCGATDFCVAFGVERKEEKKRVRPVPNIPNASVDSMKPHQAMDDTNRLIGFVVDEYHTKCVIEGNHVSNVFGNFLGLKQVQYDANSVSNAPPMNVVYGTLPPPPPSAPHTNYNGNRLPHQEKF